MRIGRFDFSILIDLLTWLFFATRGWASPVRIKFDTDVAQCQTVQIYWSGAKGFSVEIPARLFGWGPSADLPGILQHMARRFKQARYTTLDLTIYDARRLWRVPNTRHGKSGLFKIPLTASEALTLKRPGWRDELTIHRHLIPYFKDVRLSAIDQKLITDYKAQRAKEAKPATVNRELVLLKTMFTKAMVWRMADSNPVKGVELFAEDNQVERMLSEEEEARLLEACAGRFAYFTRVYHSGSQYRNAPRRITGFEMDQCLLILRPNCC